MTHFATFLALALYLLAGCSGVAGFRQEGFVACASSAGGFAYKSSDDYMSDRACLELCRYVRVR